MRAPRRARAHVRVRDWVCSRFVLNVRTTGEQKGALWRFVFG